MHRRWWVSLAVAALALLAGCAGLPSQGGPAAPPAPDRLDVEQRRLARALGGTPALVVLDDDGALWVELPAARAFAPGRADVQPTLATVLDEVATTLARVPAARLRLRLPPDAGGAVLADRRTAQVRAHLARAGIAPTRVQGGAAAPAGRVLVGAEVAALRPPVAGRAAP
jgi:outer membrane protein OmpA-like peptidoglycan-associated protein